jgi:alpha-D-ribose 1-methylphosphonate 5-triphosphate synthase subunit PhnH
VSSRGVSTQINIAASPIATINPAAKPVSLAIATAKALILLDFTVVAVIDAFDVVTGISPVNGKFVTLFAEVKTGTWVAKLSTRVPNNNRFSIFSIMICVASS